MIDNKKYTVGWICAITTEFVAAQAFLDDEHATDELQVAENDSNNYALGRIGRHHVVIAVMPDGEYGNTSAAMVGRDMVHSFPNARIGLMVGIAGGAPSAMHDIRLGDIVVSRTDGARGVGGVLCYDFGRSVQNQSFQKTAFLNQPPVLLRTSVASLRATYERKGHQLEKAVEDAVKSIMQRTKYSRPSPESDRLYKADIVHPPDDTDYGPDDIACRCGKLCGSGPDLLISRTKRTAEQHDPAIHYGIIASGNQLMQDAHIRDSLIKEKDVLCFEMEAAGLMNHFPCLVIRGICDYSDTHKNKEWQGFAAMMAAAYAKDLLLKIPQHKVEEEKQLIQVLEQSTQVINNRLAAVQDSISTVHRNVFDAIQDGRERHEATETSNILEWLCSENAWHPQTEFFRRRQEGTGEWLLNSPEYQSWVQTEGQTLLCPGLPGAGKTILMSTVVNDLTTRLKGSPKIGVAFIYCDYKRREEQTHYKLLGSILKQLSQGLRAVPESVRLMYREHNDRGMPPTAEILSGLKAVTGMYSRIFIAIDALDEQSDSSRTRLLSEIFALHECSSINIFATSRFNKDIEASFSGAVTLEIKAHPKDIQSYVSGQMDRLASFVRRDQNLQLEIQERLIEVVDGMFLLAKLHLDSLAGAVTVKDIRATLAGFVVHSEVQEHVYDLAYHDAILRIRQNNANGRWVLVRKVLTWITYARRPLKAVELQHALAVEIGTNHLDADNMAQIDDFISFSEGLVTVERSTGAFRLVHYTMQEYLQRTKATWFHDPESHITDICITYLMFDNFKEGPCRATLDDPPFGSREFKERMLQNPFYSYAALNWGHHARETPSVRPIISRLFEAKGQLESHIQVLMVSQWKEVDAWPYRPCYPTGTTRLHLAAYFGLVREGGVHLKETTDPDPRDSFGRTPLSLAAQNGFEAMVKLLLSTGKVDVNSTDNDNETPLSLAVQGARIETVRLLLKVKNIDINIKDNKGETPLLSAAKLGRETITKMLLDTGKTDVNARDNLEKSALFGAIRFGHLTICALLLKTGNVDINEQQGKDMSTPLMTALEFRHENVAKMLLASEGIDVTSRDAFGQTALHFAAENGYEAIVKLLLETGRVDVDSRADDNTTPLLKAVAQRQKTIALLLLSTAMVDVTVTDIRGNSPLSEAAEFGDKQLMQQLLDTMRDGDLNRLGITSVIRDASSEMMRFILASVRVQNVDAIVSLADFFKTYGRWGRLGIDQEEVLRQFVVEKRKVALGADHHETLEALARLDDVYHRRQQIIDFYSDPWNNQE